MRKIAQQLRYMIKEALNFGDGRMREEPFSIDPKTGKAIATKVFTIKGFIAPSVVEIIAGNGQGIYITDQGWFLANPSAGITSALGTTSVVGQPIQPAANPPKEVGKTNDGKTIMYKTY